METILNHFPIFSRILTENQQDQYWEGGTDHQSNLDTGHPVDFAKKISDLDFGAPPDFDFEEDFEDNF